MIITAITYATEAQTQVDITCSDQDPIKGAPWPCAIWMRENIDAWLAIPGNSVGAWVDPTDYMAKMRSERDTRIDAIYWRIERRQTQDAGGIQPNDNNTKMDEIYVYLQDLRDMPEDNPNTDTKAKYDALVWPTKPS